MVALHFTWSEVKFFLFMRNEETYLNVIFSAANLVHLRFFIPLADFRLQVFPQVEVIFVISFVIVFLWSMLIITVTLIKRSIGMSGIIRNIIQKYEQWKTSSKYSVITLHLVSSDHLGISHISPEPRIVLKTNRF